MHLRTAVAEDSELLASLVVEAVNWTGEIRMTREQVMAEPELNHYVTGWKRKTDFGLVALADDGAPLGAIWWRLFPDDEPATASSPATSRSSAWRCSPAGRETAWARRCSANASTARGRPATWPCP